MTVPSKLDNLPAIRRRTANALNVMVIHGSEVYCRARHLPRVIPIGPEELVNESEYGSRLIVAKLALALQAERTLGRRGHWAYDLNRHIALAEAHEAERRLLSQRGAVVG